MPLRHSVLERRGDVFCVRLRKPRLEETAIHEFAAELLGLVTEDGCRKLVLSLGPEPPQCLYSIFLAKLITVQRRLGEHNGALRLCEVHPDVHALFEACKLDKYFRFVPDVETAVAELSR